MAVTRADVARLAGVSPAVVSYVINNGPRPVSAERRASVERAIQVLGYRPNAVARALASSSTHMMGLVTPGPSNSFFAELAEAIETSAFDSGNVLLMGITNEDASREMRYVQAFVDRHVDGLLVISGRHRNTIDTAAKDIPTVIVDRVVRVPHSSSVAVDSLRGARTCVEHLQSHGLRLIACIDGPPDLGVSSDRLTGWRLQQESVGLPAESDLSISAAFTPEGGQSAMRDLLVTPRLSAAVSAGEQVGVFVCSDHQALGVLKACAAAGLRVPEDVALVSFDGTRLSGNLVPSLTSFRQPVEQIAAEAVGELIRRVEHPETDPREIVLQGNLRIGQSCGC